MIYEKIPSISSGDDGSAKYLEFIPDQKPIFEGVEPADKPPPVPERTHRNLQSQTPAQPSPPQHKKFDFKGTGW